MKLQFLILFLFFKINCFTTLNFFKLHKCPKKITKTLLNFSKIYSKNILNNKQKHNLIPLKLHQIWIGPNPLPEKFKWMIETWKKFHPHWEYKLWSNEDLKNVKLINQKAFNLAQNWGQKSDILRYEILFNYGGVYLDIDFECLKNLDNFNFSQEFYCCLLPETDVIANGIIASKPKHPILFDCITQIKKIKKFSENTKNILMTTGPTFFTKIIESHLYRKDLQNILILPSIYFFPFPATLRKMYWENQLIREKILSFTNNVSYGIHYWATSWQ